MLSTFRRSGLILPLLSCGASTALERTLFENRPTVAETAMKSAGTLLGRMMWRDISAHVAGRRNNSNPALNAVTPEHIKLVLLLGKGNNTGDALYAAAACLAEASLESNSQFETLRPPEVKLVACFDTSAWDAGVQRASEALFQTNELAMKNYEARVGFNNLSDVPSPFAPFTGHERSIRPPPTTSEIDFRENIETVSMFTCKTEAEAEVLWRKAVRPHPGQAIVVLDGIFGMQFKAPLRGPSKFTLDICNRDPYVRVRCAVDVPSGFGDTCDFESAFRSDYTYATGIAKNTLVGGGLCSSSAQEQQQQQQQQENRDKFVGRLRLVDLGFFHPRSIYNNDTEDKNFSIDAEVEKHILSASLSSAAAVQWILSPLAHQVIGSQPRSMLSDKRTFGNMLIVAGSTGMPGAVVMAATAAIRSGVGLLTVAAPPEVCRVGSVSLPEAMWIHLPTVSAQETDVKAMSAMNDETFAFLRHGVFGASTSTSTSTSARAPFDTVLVGMGMGRAASTQAFIQSVAELCVERNIPTAVFDADALQPELVKTLQWLKSRSGNTTTTGSTQFILTPHAGELNRMVSAVKGNEAAGAAAQQLVDATGCILVEKGPRTWVWGKEQTVTHSVLIPAGGPVLARGGSGDVLAGLIAGSCAAAAKSADAAPTASSVFETVSRAVLRHGMAADASARTRGEEAARTMDVIDAL